MCWHPRARFAPSRVSPLAPRWLVTTPYTRYLPFFDSLHSSAPHLRPPDTRPHPSTPIRHLFHPTPTLDPPYISLSPSVPPSLPACLNSFAHPPIYGDQLLGSGPGRALRGQLRAGVSAKRRHAARGWLQGGISNYEVAFGSPSAPCQEISTSTSVRRPPPRGSWRPPTHTHPLAGACIAINLTHRASHTPIVLSPSRCR